MLAAEDPWRWQAHPEVWVLVIGLIALGGFAVKRIGPRVVPPGTPVVTRRQVGCFIGAVALLELASDWPLHDLAEQRLYFLHMIQHLLMTFIIPPLVLLATPAWFARLVVLDGSLASRVIRRMCHPVFAGVVFNGLIALTHWTSVVSLSVRNGPFHFALHLALFGSALLLWMAVVGPLEEVRVSPPARMVLLFMSSVIPTIPAAWLTFAEGIVYKSYDTTYRLWGVSARTDQQVAGLIMKLVGGFLIWTVIFVLFVRFARSQERANQRPPVTLNGPLTFEDVEQAFRDAGPAEPERVTR